MEDFSKPIVGNCLANSSTSVLNFPISAWISGSVSTAALKSFNFAPITRIQCGVLIQLQTEGLIHQRCVQPALSLPVVSKKIIVSISLTCGLLDLHSDSNRSVKELSNFLEIFLYEASACQSRGSFSKQRVHFMRP